MARRVEVRIERLALRLRGVPAPLARTALDGLGRDLMERLAGLLVPPEPAGRTELPLLDAGTIRVPHSPGADGVRDAIVGALAGSIETGRDGQRKE